MIIKNQYLKLVLWAILAGNNLDALDQIHLAGSPLDGLEIPTSPDILAMLAAFDTPNNTPVLLDENIDDFSVIFDPQSQFDITQRAICAHKCSPNCIDHFRYTHQTQFEKMPEKERACSEKTCIDNNSKRKRRDERSKQGKKIKREYQYSQELRKYFVKQANNHFGCSIPTCRRPQIKGNYFECINHCFRKHKPIFKKLPICDQERHAQDRLKHNARQILYKARKIAKLELK